MVSFIRKRLQVFVSSTFSDLIHDRQAAVEAILTAGHIPAGMELFTSGDESQMEVIKQWIDESDVFVLILGGRYGSVEPTTGKSYTQIEYEYAVKTNKPLFSCVINETAIEQRLKARGTEIIEMDSPQKLKAFRAEVLTKMVRFWDDHKDIKIAIGETLSHFSRRDELPGWIRAGDGANVPALADEITRLSKENSVLRRELTYRAFDEKILGVGFQELKQLLECEGLLDMLPRFRMPEVFSAELYGDSDAQKVFKLLGRGLIEVSAKGVVTLSKEGRIFLNRLDTAPKSAKSDVK